MPDDVASLPAAALLPVSVIGETGIVNGTVAQTVGDQPNLVVNLVTPLAAIAVRFLNTYLTVLVGLVSVGLTTTEIPASNFYHLVLKCAGLSIAGAGFGLLKDLVTIFGRLEDKYPLLTGSI